MAEKKDAHHILKTIKDKEIKFVDLRFTDPRGKWQHVTFDLSLIDETCSTTARCSTVLPTAAGKPSTNPT